MDIHFDFEHEIDAQTAEISTKLPAFPQNLIDLFGLEHIWQRVSFFDLLLDLPVRD
jgi:hypothetical protein